MSSRLPAIFSSEASLVLAASGPGQFREDQVVTRGVPLKTCLWLAEHGYHGYLQRHIPSTFFTPEFRASDPARVDWLVETTHQGGTGSHWEQSQYLAAHLPDPSFRSIPEVAHGYFWQAPEATVTELLAWLGSRRSAAPAG